MSGITKLNRYGQRPYPFAEKCALGLYCTKSAVLTCQDCEGRFCKEHAVGQEHECPGLSEVTVDEAVQRG